VIYLDDEASDTDALRVKTTCGQVGDRTRPYPAV